MLPLLSVYWISSGFILLLLSFFFFFFFFPFFLASSFSFSSLSKSSAVFKRVSGHQPFIFLARKMESRGPARSFAISIVHLADDFAPRTMSLRRNSIEPEGGRGSEDISLFLFGKHLRFSFNAVDSCLTQEVVGSDSVVVPNLQRQNSRLSKLRLLQREKGLLLLIHHLFLQDGWKTFIYTKQTEPEQRSGGHYNDQIHVETIGRFRCVPQWEGSRSGTQISS